MKKILENKLLRFLLVGLVNSLVGNSVMFIFYNFFHLSYWVSTASNYLLAGAVSYYLNKRFTFAYKGTGWRPILRFLLHLTVCYLLAYSAAQPLVSRLLRDASPVWHDNAAMLVGMLLFMALNYVGLRYFVFRESQDHRLSRWLAQAL